MFLALQYVYICSDERSGNGDEEGSEVSGEWERREIT